MVTIQVIQTNGHPIPHRQVIVRVPERGRYEYGITDGQGVVHLPLSVQESGSIIVGGKKVYIGLLDLHRLVVSVPTVV